MPVPVQPQNGYVTIHRTWKKGDRIDLNLPIQPRVVFPNDSIQTIKGKIAIASGPIVYSLECIDNPELDAY